MRQPLPLAIALTLAAGISRPMLADVPNLPDEFTVDISLETPIDSDSASVGDPVSATLRKSIKVGKTEVAPKGAKLSGQIKRLDNRRGSYTIELTFNSLDFNDGHQDLSQRANEVLQKVITHVSQLSGATSVQAQPAETDVEILNPLLFKTKHLKLPRGTPLVLHSTK